MARVMISVPCHAGVVQLPTFDSLIGMDHDGHEIIPGSVIAHDCQTARIDQAKLALEKGADYLLMVDWDVVLPKDALKNLMSHNQHICSGYYVRAKSDVGRTVVVKKNSHLFDDCYFDHEIAQMRESGEYLVEIKASGAGCLLIRTSVFNHIPKPWFEFKPTEDFYFCDKARYSGYKVYMDTRVRCNHHYYGCREAK